MLQVKNLYKDFNGEPAVKNLSITVKKGDVYGFLGPNGAGKTTSIKMILGLLIPTRGEILVEGKPAIIGRGKCSEKIGAMIETPCFYDNLSGRKNLMIAAALHGKAAEKRVDEVIRIVEMEDAANKKVAAYSMGMKQRLGIARAFLHDPEIIILDEPTNGLDPYGMKSVRELILHLSQRYGKTFIVSTHLLSEVELLCNRIGIIHNGSLVEEVSMNLILNNKTLDISFEDYFISLTQEERNYA
jgi:ABC-2 type transport system ATP-binding protein